MKFENISVWGFEHVLRGMRNPLNSWNISDSFICYQGNGNCENCPHFINHHSLGDNLCLKEAE